ncbi:MAG: HEAT repeat domain-containing protein [Pyrinomonadaceae bacterium]
MGKHQAAERAKSGVRKSITNYELRITNCFKLFAILCALCAFAANTSAQNLESLADAVRSGTTEIKRDALLQIRNLQTANASRVAVPALRDSSEIIRAAAAFSVIFLPKEEAAQSLLPLLNDKSELVRREAAYALGKVGNPSAITPLIQIFQKDKILEVRNAAIVALGEIGDAGAVDVLTQILQKKPKEEDEFQRRSAARSAGQIAQFIQTGEIGVITPQNFLPDKFKTIEKPKYPNLIENFSVFRAAVSVLIQILQNPKESQDTKREAAFALGAIGDKSSIPVLQANLNNEDYYLSEICKEALLKIQN